jgi:hypothetical protein
MDSKEEKDANRQDGVCMPRRRRKVLLACAPQSCEGATSFDNLKTAGNLLLLVKSW